MIMTCTDRERIFLDGTPEEWTSLEAHALTCAVCREELRAFKSLSALASELRKEWDSPSLWPRIERALSQQGALSRGFRWQRFFPAWSWGSLEWRAAAAALVLVAVTSFGMWLVLKPKTPAIEHQALLKDSAVNEVEHAEAAYERAIDKLDRQARPELGDSSQPLMASYREKLLVLDSAIADLKSQAGINPANSHLRRQLLAMYQEKQDTLELVLEAKK